MILKQDDFQDTIVGAEMEQAFSIDTESSVIFEILRDKMYKDKIGSICREVASNSRDANREAGSDKPIEIKVISPNRLLSISHPSISFKDYGAGIPPNKMSDIYLKYGASDKRNTDTLTGGFGLGAKTPFAYNDTFTVITVADYAEPIMGQREVEESVFDEYSEEKIGTRTVTKTVVVGHKPVQRKKYKYTAMIDSSQKGKMVLFGEPEVTDEPTGTEVIVPIKTSEDRYKFEKEALKYTKTWGDEVTYKGFVYTQEELETVYSDEDVIIYKTNEYQYGGKVQLLIDEIPYPLDTEHVKVKDTIGRNSSFYITILKFNTGEVSISANRESVQYDEDTVAAIEAKYGRVSEILDELLSNHIEAQETYLDACILTYYINRKSSNNSSFPALTGALLAHAKTTGFKFKNINWKGLPTTDKFMFKHHVLFEVSIENGRNKYESTRIFNFKEGCKDLPIYYGDVRKNAKRNENIWEEGHDKFILVKPYDTNDKEGIQEFMDFIFGFDLDFNIYSDLEVKKTVSEGRTYVKKSYVNLNIRTVDKYGYTNKDVIQLDRKTFEPEFSDDDLSKSVYVTVNKLSNTYGVDKNKLGLAVKEGYKAFIVRNKDYANWFVNTPMKHIDEVYEEIEQKIIDEKKEKVKNKLIYDIIEDKVNTKYINVIKDILPKSCRDAKEDYETSYTDVDLVKKHLKFDFDGLRRKINRIFDERYPLIALISKKWRYSFESEKGEKQIELYIKQVNNYYGI